MEKLFGLIGHPLTHSFSKKYFNAFFSKNKLPYSYQNFDFDSLQNIHKVFENNKLHGLNITIPYKEKIIGHLNKIDLHAENIGAVNTILINRTGNSFTTIGYNTDYFAFKLSLQKFLNKPVKKALILGTGGASKAVEYALKKMSINYLIVSRNPINDQITYLDINKSLLNEYLLVINTTPVGMFPEVEQAPDIPYKYLSNKHILYDLVYNPLESMFLRNGLKQKTKVKNGLEMLQLQAQLSWKIWNKENDIDEMKFD